MVKMRLRRARATLLGYWRKGTVIRVSEAEAARLEEAGDAERVEELELATAEPTIERPERRPRGRPRRRR